MKIILVSNTDWFLYNFRLSTAIGIQKQGINVLLASPYGKYVKKIKKYGFIWKQMNFSRRRMNVFCEIHNILRLVKFYSQERPDIVMHYTIKPVIYGSIAARFLGIPTINTITGLGYAFIEGKERKLLRKTVEVLYRFALKKTNVIFINKYDLQYFVKFDLVKKRNSHLISGSGIDFIKYRLLPFPNEPFSIAFVGRLLKDKGVYEFVKAARRIKKGHPQINFILVGSIDKENPASLYEKEIEEWVKEGIINYWGWQENIISVYEKVHIVCLPSYREGLPKTLLEAAACGRPIVTTDVPGCRDIVTHNRNGLLVPPQDAKALASAIENLINRPEELISLGKNGRDMVMEKFSEEKTVNQTLDLINLVFEQRKKDRESH